jgi:hypothetical protein
VEINPVSASKLLRVDLILFFLLWLGVHVRAASNSAYSGYPELRILRYPAHRYHAVPSPGFEPTTLWLRRSTKHSFVNTISEPVQERVLCMLSGRNPWNQYLQLLASMYIELVINDML